MADSVSWIAQLVESQAVQTLCERVESARGSTDPSIAAVGSRGSSTNIIAGCVAHVARRPVLLVVAHLDEADDALEDLHWLRAVDPAFDARRFGALEVLPGESNVSLELLAERLAVAGELGAARSPNVIVAPVQALMQTVPKSEAMARFTFALAAGDELPPGDLLAWLGDAGYTRVDAIEQPGEFAMRGGIVDIYPPAGSADISDAQPDTSATLGPIRIDYFGDEIDSISAIDLDTMGSKQRITRARILGASSEQIQNDDDKTSLMELLADDTIIIMHEVLELTEQARGYFERLTNPRGIVMPNTVFAKLGKFADLSINQYGGGDANAVKLPIEAMHAFAQDAADAVRELGELATGGLPIDSHSADRSAQLDVHVLCEKPAERDRLLELIREHVPDAEQHIKLEIGYLHRGFRLVIGAQGRRDLLLLPHHELFHRYHVRRRVRRVATAQSTDAFFDLDVGDYVVHIDHGIAKFIGIKTMKRQGVSQEYLTLQFAQSATLHVPATQIDLIQRYIGGFEGKPPLSMLGGKRWGKQKEQVADAVKDLAAELLRVQAARESMPGIRYPQDTAWQAEFEAEFPYDETEDQLAAIEQVKRDMCDDTPMDRLICGDVGFGKTEVAIRAAFKAAEFGKQVAVLVPTTVLAEQHERTFRSRMADYPFRIESISRFKTGAQQRKTLKDLAAGRIDIVIGTHRLLSKDVKFADLGLVIIDEEQRFGVEHKNTLLQFRLTADVMTLTATPIPRTLHMSMLGLRDISSLTTPPVDRRAIVTEVIPYDEDRIKQAIIRELSREGQIFYLHNRVYDIESVADEVQKLAPDARIVIGHGQMPPRALEKVMLQFIRREADILVSTTIIESGIDIATANTMIIDQADHFGLADLHQLRGRVGRYKHRAYCYLLLPPDRSVNEVAAKRLRAIEQYSMLGAGFKIAMRDLEIRGAGNLLGAEQSGHIAAVGYEMYCQLLDRETKKLKNQPIITPAATHIEVPFAGGLPKRYIASDKHRMEMYRRISRALELSELAGVVEDMTDAYGKPPAKAQMLIDLTELRIAISHLNIDSLKLEGPDLILKTQTPRRLDALLAAAPGRVTVIDDRTIYYRPPGNYLDPPATLLAVLRKLFVTPVRENESAAVA